MDLKRFRGSMTLVRMVKSNMEDIIAMYGYVTVADYYDIIGYASVYTDNKNGWVSLEKAEIAITDDPYIFELILPKPLPI